MKTISAHVEDFMRGYPFTSKTLRQGLLNYKAFAREIEPAISKQVGEKVSVGAIAVSLQRLHHRDKDKLYNLIGRLKGVKVISNLAVFHTKDSATAFRLISQLESTEQLEQPFALAIRADSEVVILVEKFLGDTFKTLATGTDITEDPAKLTALIITREVLVDAETEVGGLSYPLQVLAENGILTRAVSASFTEEVIVVDESVADRAAMVLRHAMWR